MATTQLMTAAELWKLGEDEGDFELIDGVPIEMMSPVNQRHGEILATLSWLLAEQVIPREEGRLLAGDVGFVLRLNPDTVLAPDLAYVRSDRLPPPGELDGFLHLAPDLAIEIISPGNSPGQIETKTGIYLESGVAAVWLVYPKQRQVVVHVGANPPVILGERDILDGGDTLPHFRVPVAKIFDL